MGALSIVALVLVLGGLICLGVGIFNKIRAGRITDAPLVPTGDAGQRGAQVASPKGALSVQGNVVCQQPLMSPVSGTPCLFWQIKLTARWKQGDTHKSQTLDEKKMAAQFAIDDGSGPVWIDATEGGDLIPTVRKSEKQGAGIIGGIVGREIRFGNYSFQTPMMAIGTTYEVDEEVFPVQQHLYVCGKTEQNYIKAPGWRSLIAANKTRDELLQSASKLAKTLLIAGGAAVFLGSASGVAAALTGGDDAKSAATATDAGATATAGSDAGATTASAGGDAAAAATSTVATAAAAKPGAKPAVLVKPATKAGKK